MKKIFITSCVILTLQNLTAQTTNPSPYCDASFDDAQGFFVDDHINKVTFGNLTNTSNGHFNAPHYVFYNNLTTQNFTKGSSYQLTLDFKVSGGCGYGVWIDYNKNNQFEANERIAGTTGQDMLDLSNNTIVSSNITIPANASLGQTRMRVRIVEDDNHNMNSTLQEPCNASTSDEDVMDWGETEDYTINIVDQSNAIKEIENSTGIFIYPNPANDFLYLSSTQNFIESVEIYDLSGHKVDELIINEENSKIQLNKYQKGIYYLKIMSNNQCIDIQKLIKN